MTAGTKTISGRVSVSTGCSSSDQYGPFYEKVWNGSDRVRENPVYVTLRNPLTGKYYRSRKKTRRREIPHPYTASITVLDRALMQATRSGNPAPPCGNYYTWTQGASCFQIVPSWGSDPWTANDDLKLLSKLHAKVYGSDFNAGVFLAEARKGLRMIRESAQKLTNAVSAYKRGNRIDVIDALGMRPDQFDKYVHRKRRTSNPELNMANMWAEYKWGWTPLMKDMYDGAQWVAHFLHAPVEFRLAVRRRIYRDVPIPSNSTTGIWHKTARWTRQKQLIAYLKEPPHKAILDVINPASIAWELVPYSFVVDWFVPIGTFLQVRGLPSTLSGTFVTTDVSEREGLGQKLTLAGAGCPWTNLVVLAGKNRTLFKTINRTVSTSLSAPDPVFRGFGADREWTHTVDVWALLRQKLKGR